MEPQTANLISKDMQRRDFVKDLGKTPRSYRLVEKNASDGRPPSFCFHFLTSFCSADF